VRWVITGVVGADLDTNRDGMGRARVVGWLLLVPVIVL
jgi:hypothetical protein